MQIDLSTNSIQEQDTESDCILASYLHFIYAVSNKLIYFPFDQPRSIAAMISKVTSAAMTNIKNNILNVEGGPPESTFL